MYLILLDTPCNKRRYRINKVILGYGVRVQKSVYECQIDQPEKRELIAEIKKLINNDEDTLRIQPCCQKDWQKILVSGGPQPLEDKHYWLID